MHAPSRMSERSRVLWHPGLNRYAPCAAAPLVITSVRVSPRMEARSSALMESRTEHALTLADDAGGGPLFCTVHCDGCFGFGTNLEAGSPPSPGPHARTGRLLWARARRTSINIIYRYTNEVDKGQCAADVPERLRGCTRNALGSARVSSSLTVRAINFGGSDYDGKKDHPNASGGQLVTHPNATTHNIKITQLEGLGLNR